MEAVCVVLHVDALEPRLLLMALHNAANLRKHYAESPVEIEIVVNGPGVRLLRDEPGPLRDRIAGGVPPGRIVACANTLRVMAEEEGQPPALIPEVGVVPSGIVRLVELQRAGYAYVKP